MTLKMRLTERERKERGNIGNRNLSLTGYIKTCPECIQCWQTLRNSCGLIYAEQSDQGRGRINALPPVYIIEYIHPVYIIG